MKWIVGLDFRPSCIGALAWAQWLREHGGGSQEAVAAHVIEIPPGWGGPTLDAERMGEDAREFLRECGFELEVRLLEGMDPVDGLARVVAIHRADALAIGRRSAMDGDEIVRLGRVARRLLRRLPVPVAVCPADLEPSALPPGPVLVGVSPESPSAAAVRFGRALAQSIGRDAVFGVVLPPAFPRYVTYHAAPDYRGREHEAVLFALSGWLGEQGVRDAAPVVAEGFVAPGLRDLAAELRACAIVCGSRLLSVGDRIMQSSIGAALAGTAVVPVVAVPPP